MYELAFCYPYNSMIFWDGRDTELNKHWLSIKTIKTIDFYTKEYELRSINYFTFLDERRDLDEKINNCSFVRSPQIIETYYIEDTMLCILKTIWIKIFQRKYRNYYNKKMKYYKNPKNILNRSINGKFLWYSIC
tara:strand:+ start:380 stop:781 length:402 start_codon:yes stop_codon:yes gene_type:complete